MNAKNPDQPARVSATQGNSKSADFVFAFLGTCAGVLFACLINWLWGEPSLTAKWDSATVHVTNADGTVATQTMRPGCGHGALAVSLSLISIAAFTGVVGCLAGIVFRRNFVSVSTSAPQSNLTIIPSWLLTCKPTLAEQDDSRDRWGAS